MLFGNETTNGSKDILHLHHAIITSGRSKRKFLASCLTFYPPDEVPLGSSNRVSSLLSLWLYPYFMDRTLLYHIPQMGIYLNLGINRGYNYIRLYMYNKNQGTT